MSVKKQTRYRAGAETAKEGAYCVYIGPSIRGVLQSGRVFATPRSEALRALEREIAKYPQISALVVDGAALAESRRKVKTPGNLLYVKYKEMLGQ